MYPGAWKVTIILGVLIVLAGGWWLLEYSRLPREPHAVTLKNGQVVKGRLEKQEFGKYLLLEKADNTRQVIIWDQVADVSLDNPPWYFRPDEVAETVVKFGVIGGVLVFAIGLWQYGITQKWERAKFIIERVKEFEANNWVQSAQAILSGPGASVYIHGADEDPVVVDEALLVTALGRVSPGSLPRDARGVRSAFDAYFSFLDEFNHFLWIGVARKKEISLYLEHWLKIIGDPTSPQLTANARDWLWDYMNTNNYKGSIKLLRRFGYKPPETLPGDVTPPPPVTPEVATPVAPPAAPPL